MPAERSTLDAPIEADRIRRVVAALEHAGQLSMVVRAAELARENGLPLEIVGARVRVSPMLYFAPVNVASVREMLATQSHQMVIRAVATVPQDVAATARLVDGKAWPEVERMAKESPGEILAIRMNRSSRRHGRAVMADGQTFVFHL